MAKTKIFAENSPVTWLLCLLLWLPAFALAQQSGAADAMRGWPRTVAANGIQVTVYQPQLDYWNNVELQVHSAIAATFPGATSPTYGVLSLSATTLVDKSSRIVRLDRIQRLDARFPSTPERETTFISSMRTALLNGIGEISLDRLEAAKAMMQAEHESNAQPPKNDPPLIFVSDRPALLAYIDGEPRWQAIEGAPLERVVNTRVLLLRNHKGQYFLHFMDGYLTAASLGGSWNRSADAPLGAAVAEKLAEKERQIDLLAGQADKKNGKKPSLSGLTADRVPTVYVATQPAELIVFDGPVNYAPLDGTDLLYARNTTANVFKDLVDQQSYVLLSGRWFRAAGLNGPWTYVAPRELPAEFAKIPDNSPKENVKASIPGTSQAREAVIANEIPQTAKVDREKTVYTSVIDGAPQLRAIEGTPLQYVYNAADPIIRVDENSWYALHNAVWFIATSVNGPWVVATSVPAVIYSIPVSSPLHYATYVRIYDVAPAYVVVGYTPGYYGTVVTGDGVVVYGTGYVYTPWVGTYWYGPPVTYGIGMSIVWTPWGSWAYGFGFGWGCWAAWGWDDWYPPAPWWGPYWGGAYANAYGGVTAWGPNGWAGTTGNIYRSWGSAQSVGRGFAGYNAYTGNEFAGRYGAAYNSRTGAMTVGRQGAVQNVYTGNWAAGGQGARYNPTTGVASHGGRVTFGNPNTGNTVTAGHVNAYDTRTGQSVNAGRISNNQGESIGHINNNVFGTKDGQVYRYNPNNPDHWQPVNQESARNNLQNRAQNLPGEERRQSSFQQPERQSFDRDRFDRDWQSRNTGAMRENAFQQHGAQFGGRFGGGHFGGGFRGRR